MYDKQFIQKMCNFECSLKELRSFCSDFEKEKIFKENMFDKYYDVNTILLALIKFEQRKVNASYMADWTEAYYNIIEDGFKAEYGQKMSLKQYVRRRLAHELWWLHINFDDYGLYIPDIATLKVLFGTIDCVLRDIDNCKVFCARKHLRSPFPKVLIVNDDKKYFIKETYYVSDLDDYVKDDEIDFEKIAKLDMQKRIKQMQKSGYTQLTMY